MRIIELQSGISVNVEFIEAVEEKDSNSCKVYVGTRTYEATYPYKLFIQMLNSEKLISKDLTQEEKMDKTMSELKGVLGKVGHFAG